MSIKWLLYYPKLPKKAIILPNIGYRNSIVTQNWVSLRIYRIFKGFFKKYIYPAGNPAERPCLLLGNLDILLNSCWGTAGIFAISSVSAFSIARHSDMRVFFRRINSVRMMGWKMSKFRRYKDEHVEPLFLLNIYGKSINLEHAFRLLLGTQFRGFPQASHVWSCLLFHE